MQFFKIIIIIVVVFNETAADFCQWTWPFDQPGSLTEIWIADGLEWNDEMMRSWTWWTPGSLFLMIASSRRREREEEQRDEEDVTPPYIDDAKHREIFFFFFFWHAVRINPRREQQMVLELRRSSKDVNSAAEDAAASLRLTERHWGCSDGTSWALSSVDRIKDWRLSANYHELPRWGWQVGRAQRA